MNRRRPTWPSVVVLVVAVVAVGVLGGVVGGVFGVFGGGGVGGVVDAVAALVGVVALALAGVAGVVVALDALVGVVTRRGRSVHGRRTRTRTRSSGLPGGLGGIRVCRGGALRRLLRACTSVDRLVDYLLDRAVATLPAAASARFAEEWQDHRQHYSGWRLVWWALWVRATAPRTVTALGSARLPRDS